MAEKAAQRATCARCTRPPQVCYCPSLPPDLLATERTHVLVVQHKHEKRRRAAISSVPILAQSLQNVTLVTVDDDCDCSPGVHRDLDELLYGGGDEPMDAALVLFPDDRALPLEAIGGESTSIRSSKRVLLVVIDGTWREAKKIARRNRNTWDQAAQSWEARGARFHYVCLGTNKRDDGGPGPSSIYGDLRREPMEGCMSTLEAVASALRVLEPASTGPGVHDSLLHAFRAMVSIQEQYQERGREAKLKQYGGISKAQAVEMKRLEERQRQQLHAYVDIVPAGTTPLTHVRREYVFYSSRTDLHHYQQLLQEGDVVTCTYDEARDRCVELNCDRKRGQRIAMLSLDAFQKKVTMAKEA
ncbi:unnamed protein product [Hyaloperonospora brassicae]|uniref:tRNA-uridine aminocarboxypropyltransferase n=1 Tax=Hyaloperonospora brassicae TaxID=162125 RepID=A0AAV0UVR8_HYABA|nr:unnamed protein product [Hyaloperonospora brassicae]